MDPLLYMLLRLRHHVTDDATKRELDGLFVDAAGLPMNWAADWQEASRWPQVDVGGEGGES